MMMMIANLKKVSITRINRYALIGSPCLEPLSKGKNPVEVPPLSTQLSWQFNITETQSRKYPLKPNFLRVANKKLCSTESNAFSMSMVSIYPSTLQVFDVSRISKISLTDSPRNLSFT